MKLKYLIPILITLSGCNRNQDEKKTIDTGGFEIEVPKYWNYKKEIGTDSFVGRIVGNNVDLSFDYSDMGYANHILPDEREYVYEEMEWMPIDIPYAKAGVTYTTGNVKGERERIMKKKGITDTSLVRVEKWQTPKVDILFEGGKYEAILTYEDTATKVDIEIPEEIRNHQIQIDTVGNYKRKVVRPKDGIKGMTGVYLEDLNSDFNFNLVGRNLSINDQERAIKAFETIKMKRIQN